VRDPCFTVAVSVSPVTVVHHGWDAQARASVNCRRSKAALLGTPTFSSFHLSLMLCGHSKNPCCSRHNCAGLNRVSLHVQTGGTCPKVRLGGGRDGRKPCRFVVWCDDRSDVRQVVSHCKSSAAGAIQQHGAVPTGGRVVGWRRSASSLVALGVPLRSTPTRSTQPSACVCEECGWGKRS
jgi:hypothetical protein